MCAIISTTVCLSLIHISVDLVCRGNPSPLLFRKYLEYQQIKYKNKVTGVKFRDKYYGYNLSLIHILPLQVEKTLLNNGYDLISVTSLEDAMKIDEASMRCV